MYIGSYIWSCGETPSAGIVRSGRELSAAPTWIRTVRRQHVSSIFFIETSCLNLWYLKHMDSNCVRILWDCSSNVGLDSGEISWMKFYRHDIERPVTDLMLSQLYMSWIEFWRYVIDWISQITVVGSSLATNHGSLCGKVGNVLQRMGVWYWYFQGAIAVKYLKISDLLPSLDMVDKSAILEGDMYLFQKYG